jgi:hypothetical protein
VKGSDLQLYKIILLNYDELEVFKVNEINWKVLSFIKWRYGNWELKDILCGQYAEEFEPNYCSESKEEILNGLNKCMGVEEAKLNYFRNVIEKFFI